MFRYIFITPAQAIYALRNDIKSLKEYIMASNAELQASLEAISEKLDEASVEIPAKLAELRALIVNSGPGTTPAIDAIIAGISTRAAALAEVANADPPG